MNFKTSAGGHLAECSRKGSTFAIFCNCGLKKHEDLVIVHCSATVNYSFHAPFWSYNESFAVTFFSLCDVGLHLVWHGLPYVPSIGNQFHCFTRLSKKEINKHTCLCAHNSTHVNVSTLAHTNTHKLMNDLFETVNMSYGDLLLLI